MQTVDEHFVDALSSHVPVPAQGSSIGTGCDARLVRLFEAQVESRHLDFAARWLQKQGKGFYTIGSAGHESNAAVGLLSRTTDPALLHYRSGGFYAARAATGPGDSVRDVLASLTVAKSDPMSGGRHKVYGHPALGIVPQTSTIASHLPRAVGLAFSLEAAPALGVPAPWPDDAVVVCSFGDASANHSTALGALNTAAYLGHRGIGCPVLFVCEDNRIGISTKSPLGWPEAMLSTLSGVPYRHADGADPVSLLRVVDEALTSVRTTRRAGILHLRTVRYMGHAGSDAEIAYRSQREIMADYDRDPVLATARTLADRGVRTTSELLEHYEAVRRRVMSQAEQVADEPRLGTREEVIAPLTFPATAGRPRSWHSVAERQAGGPGSPAAPVTLAQAINRTLSDLMTEHANALVFGEDVAVKGGVYGVTRGLRRRFGGHRVFDTLLDEQTIIGIALGAALAGLVPIPEIQYLAYLHNAEDQLRGEGASLRFFSGGQYQNGMVVRIAGLAYQRGFGGHFHNDNSVAVLRDIPGLVLAVPGHPADAPGILRTCFGLARTDGRVCVFLEPIARYHTRDLLHDGDGLWTAPYLSPGDVDGHVPLGEVALYGRGGDILLVTFGNGLHMSLQVMPELRRSGIHATVMDLRWLAPLPARQLCEVSRDFDHVLVVDETRTSGGVSEAVLSALIDGAYPGRAARAASADSFIPLGPGAESVLLSPGEILEAATALVRPAATPAARSGSSFTEREATSPRATPGSNGA